MKELVYGGTEVEKLIKKKFSDAKIVDASDFVHAERFEVEIDTTDEIFYRFAIRKGIALICFGFRCGMMRGDKEISKWIKEETSERS